MLFWAIVNLTLTLMLGAFFGRQAGKAQHRVLSDFIILMPACFELATDISPSA